MFESRAGDPLGCARCSPSEVHLRRFTSWSTFHKVALFSVHRYCLVPPTSEHVGWQGCSIMSDPTGEECVACYHRVTLSDPLGAMEEGGHALALGTFFAKTWLWTYVLCQVLALDNLTRECGGAQGDGSSLLVTLPQVYTCSQSSGGSDVRARHSPWTCGCSLNVRVTRQRPIGLRQVFFLGGSPFGVPSAT